jgi:hypothetical protein
MRRELNVYAAADRVWTVSEKEACLINDLMGRPIAYSIPDREDVGASTVPLRAEGILFIETSAIRQMYRPLVPLWRILPKFRRTFFNSTPFILSATIQTQR